MKTKIQFVARILVVLAFVTGAGCGLFTNLVSPQPTAVPDTPVPPTASAAAASTQTQAPAGTAVPLLTPTITQTDAPEPTPTPDGYVREGSLGLSLLLPEGWEVTEQSADSMSVESGDGSVYLTFSSSPESEQLSIDEIVAMVIEDTAMQLKGKSSMGLSGGSIEAQVAELVYTPSGQKFDAWLVYAHNGSRGYYTWVMGRYDTLKRHRQEVADVMNTVQLFAPTLFDLSSGETLYLLGSDPLPDDLDPALAPGSAADYAGLLYAGLVRLDTSLQIVPDLAEGWKISPDGLVYTFTLRAGIKFSNGDPITAEDVRLSLERALDPATRSPTADTYLGDIVGAKDRLAGKVDQVDGIRVIDERTIEITLDGPKAYFLAKLTYPVSYVIDTRQPDQDGKDWMFAPNASGPYTVKEYKELEALILERSETYYQPAKTKNILFIFDPRGSPLSLYEEGTLDVLDVYYTDLVELQKPGNEHNAELVTAPNMCATFLSLNIDLAPTNDPLVREALFLATDREAFIERITNGQALLPTGILPPGMPGYQGERVLPAVDVAAAKAALAQSTYAGKPLSLTFSVSGYADSDRRDVALLVDQWQNPSRCR
jgi:hypothetical protein